MKRLVSYILGSVISLTMNFYRKFCLTILKIISTMAVTIHDNLINACIFLGAYVLSPKDYSLLTVNISDIRNSLHFEKSLGEEERNLPLTSSIKSVINYPTNHRQKKSNPYVVLRNLEYGKSITVKYSSDENKFVRKSKNGQHESSIKTNRELNKFSSFNETSPIYSSSLKDFDSRNKIYDTENKSSTIFEEHKSCTQAGDNFKPSQTYNTSDQDSCFGIEQKSINFSNEDHEYISTNDTSKCDNSYISYSNGNSNCFSETLSGSNSIQDLSSEDLFGQLSKCNRTNSTETAEDTYYATLERGNDIGNRYPECLHCLKLISENTISETNDREENLCNTSNYDMKLAPGSEKCDRSIQQINREVKDEKSNCGQNLKIHLNSSSKKVDTLPSNSFSLNEIGVANKNKLNSNLDMKHGSRSMVQEGKRWVLKKFQPGEALNRDDQCNRTKAAEVAKNSYASIERDNYICNEYFNLLRRYKLISDDTILETNAPEENLRNTLKDCTQITPGTKYNDQSKVRRNHVVKCEKINCGQNLTRYQVPSNKEVNKQSKSHNRDGVEVLNQKFDSNSFLMYNERVKVQEGRRWVILPRIQPCSAFNDDTHKSGEINEPITKLQEFPINYGSKLNTADTETEAVGVDEFNGVVDKMAEVITHWLDKGTGELVNEETGDMDRFGEKRKY